MVTLKFKATRGGEELSKLIRVEDLEIWTEIKEVKHVVKTSISSKDPSNTLVKLRLQFEDASKISTRQIWDRLFIKVVQDVQSRKNEYLVYLPFGTETSEFIPPQISTGNSLI